jgi:hypothetical protein
VYYKGMGSDGWGQSDSGICCAVQVTSPEAVVGRILRERVQTARCLHGSLDNLQHLSSMRHHLNSASEKVLLESIERPRIEKFRIVETYLHI